MSTSVKPQQQHQAQPQQQQPQQTNIIINNNQNNGPILKPANVGNWGATRIQQQQQPIYPIPQPTQQQQYFIPPPTGPTGDMIRNILPQQQSQQYQQYRYKNPNSRPRFYNNNSPQSQYIRHHHNYHHQQQYQQQQREANYNTENYQVPSIIKEKQFDHFEEITNKPQNINERNSTSNDNNNNNEATIDDENWTYINEKIDYK